MRKHLFVFVMVFIGFFLPSKFAKAYGQDYPTFCAR